MKKFIRVFSFVFFCWLLLVALLDGWLQTVLVRLDSADMQAVFQAQHIPVQVGDYQASGRNMHYVSVGNSRAATLLFIHGAPSSINYFMTYLTDPRLLKRARLLAIDRPGYGYSGFGKPEPSIARQVGMIRPLLDSLYRLPRPIVLVGTSYGTTVACRLAMDYPGLVDGIVLVAPSLAPGEERIYPISYPIEHPFIRWMVPRMLQSANTEKLSHRAQLTQMLPYWKNIRVPVIYLQGDRDELIYPSNASFARSHLTRVPYLSVKLIKGRGHLIAFSEKETILQAINRMLAMCQKQR